MKRLRILLALSVLLNLFLLGTLAGGAAWVRGRNPVIVAGSLRIAGAELPRPQRRAFRAALRITRAGMHDAVFESRAARQQAAAMLRQPAPDRNGILAALGRARSADLRVREAVEQRAVEFALTLPPADRSRLADAIARRAESGRARVGR